MKKTIFKNVKNDFHFGLKAPRGYVESTHEELVKYLGQLEDKKLWRCFVCNDLQLSIKPPDVCSTCTVADAYMEIDAQEFNKLIDTL